ncbi:MAG: MFS transporter [Desulfuromonadales bacterium]|nr:MFS transporter [Desulfuromonadales bacterium]
MGKIQKGSKEFKIVNFAFFAAGFVTFITLYDVQPLLPVFAKEYGVTAAISSLPLSVSTTALAFTMLIAGTFSENFGRKPVMSAALITSSILALITPLTHSFLSLLTIRTLQGIALAGLPAVAMAYLGEEIELSSLPSAMGLYVAGTGIGGMTGRVSTAMITDLSSWRTAILIVGVLCLILSGIFMKWLPKSTHFRKKKFSSKYLVNSLIKHLKNPEMLHLFILAFIFLGIFVTMYNYLAFRLLGNPYYMSHTAVSWIFLVYILGSLSSAFIGKFANRVGSQKAMLLFIITMGIGVIVTLLHSVILITIGMALLTIGFFGAHAMASSRVAAKAKVAKAQASSLYLFFYYMGSSVAGTIGGFFWSRYGWNGIVAMLMFLIIVAIVVTCRLQKFAANSRNEYVIHEEPQPT